jgi:hypothetical protein
MVFFLQWAIWLAYCQNIMESPLLQIKIHCLHKILEMYFFYIYIVLHNIK